MAALLRRYGEGARFYDVLSGERLVYRAGRLAGIRLLAPQAGDVVIDLGCGTGLNFPLLIDAIGPRGVIVGVDRSPDMLEQARRRVAVAGWGEQVRLLQADAAVLRPADVLDLAGGPADGLLATYALSVIREREAAWERACAALRPGGRACIVDMQLPQGRWRVLSPLARLACATGGADIHAHPWRMLEDAAVPSTTTRTLRRGGHIVALAGRIAGG